ncbi:MAG: hypothetical protein H6828_11425 [Planctomycetes bacterium]|nr:hypothetical protein [Planctomycetota bacterium]
MRSLARGPALVLLALVAGAAQRPAAPSLVARVEELATDAPLPSVRSSLAALHPDGHTLAFAQPRGGVVLLDVEARRARRLALELSLEERRARHRAAASVAELRALRVRELYGVAVRALAWSPDGARLAVLTEGDTLLLLEPDTAEVVAERRRAPDAPRHPWSGRELVYVAGGARLLVRGVGPRAALLDAQRLALVAELGEAGPCGVSEARACSAVAVSADGALVAVGDRGGRIALHDARTGERRGFPRTAPGPIHDLALSPDGAWLAAGSADAELRVWALASDAAARRFSCDDLDLFGDLDLWEVGFDADGARVWARTGEWLELRVWELATGDVAWSRPLEVRGGWGRTRFRADGTVLVEADGVLLDAATGVLARALEPGVDGDGDCCTSAGRWAWPWSADELRVHDLERPERGALVVPLELR